ncbi:MAG: insulinase family protein [Verrucomicrobiales bacterium]|nr:insulinase family protein [Verrucomicrobiales bacterium]
MAAIEFPQTTAQVRRLPNGLELIIKEDRSAPVVSVQAWCRVGSMHEGEKMGAGMAHFVEHMLFKGTEKRDANEIAEVVQGCGGYINAYTSFDRTVYWIDAPREGAEVCLDVLADAICHSRLPEEEFTKEQEVIRREFAMGDDNPGQVLSKQLFSTAFRAHPMRHPVIGYLDIFDTLTRDDLYEFYRREYSPDNVFFVVVGDVDADKIYDQLAEAFADVPRRSRGLGLLPTEPLQMGRRERHEEFATDLTRMRLGWHIPGGSHPDGAPLDVLSMMLGQGQSSRLYRRIREELGLAHSVSASSYSLANTGLFLLAADCEADKREAVMEELLKGLDEIKQGGVAQAELDKAMRMVLNSQFSILTTMNGQASDLGSNWLFAENLDFTRDYIANLQRVKLDDVASVVGRYFSDEGMTSVSLNPLGTLKVARVDEGEQVQAEVKKVILDNGITLLMKVDKRVPVVSVSTLFRGGVLTETESTSGANTLLTSLLTSDTENRSAEQVAEEIESVGGGFGASSGNNSLSVSGEVMRPDLDLLMDLVADALLRPAFLKQAVERERGYQLAGIKAEKDHPMSVAMRRLREELFAGHPYAMRSSGSESSVASLNGEVLRQFSEQYICGHNAVVTVYGDIDEDEVLALVKGKLGGMAAGRQAFSKSIGLATEIDGPRVVTLTHDKEQAILMAGFPTCDLAHQDRYALDLLHEACSDMSSRLFVKIREELGLAYSVGASQLLGPEPGCFLFYAATSPEKLEEVQQVLLDEIKRMRELGLDAQELQRAKKSLIGKELIRLQSSQSQAAVSGLDELLGLGWDKYKSTKQSIAALNNEDIMRVVGTYMQDESRVVVRLTGE